VSVANLACVVPICKRRMGCTAIHASMAVGLDSLCVAM
jgi:hypothetical protein